MRVWHTGYRCYDLAVRKAAMIHTHLTSRRSDLVQHLKSR